MPRETEIKRAVQLVTSIQQYRSRGRAKPHKPCLLLAVIDLFEAEVQRENRIEFNSTPRLIESFNAYFKAVATKDDAMRACIPFVHLTSDGFWHIKPRPGHEQAVKERPTRGGVSDRWVRENVLYISLDAALFEMCFDAVARNAMRDALVEKYFSSQSQEIRHVINKSLSTIRYELDLRNNLPSSNRETLRDEDVRSAAFRRNVLEAYDYRCAASGWRIVLPSVNLIDAAHLIPRGISKDDSPQNGMALTPTFHRAMDASLIAPDTSGVWRISSLLKDQRIKDFEPFQELDGKRVILPRKESNHPRDESLKYRIKRLRHE